MFRRRMTFSLLLAMLVSATMARADQVLVEIDKTFDTASVKTVDAKIVSEGNALQVETGHEKKLAGVVFKAPNGRWNLSNFQEVTVDVKNVGQTPVVVSCRVDNPGANGAKDGICGSVEVAPGGKGTLHVVLSRRVPRELRDKLFGMRGVPMQAWNTNLDPTNVVQLVIYVDKPTEDCRFQISNLRAREVPEKLMSVEESQFFPLIDTFGQYIHKTWPGKISSPEDLLAKKNEEAADLAAHPGPKDRDQYGGWKGGPKLKATGYFRTEKVAGKWWFVDPEGYLFWSYGMNGINTDSGRTPLTNRKHWFADLPTPGTPLAQFLGGSPEATYNTDTQSPAWKYYWGKSHESFDFSEANLFRKYGKDWETAFYDVTQRRLQSWGLNSLGCATDSKLIRNHKTPYVAMFGCNSKRLAGSEGYWGKFADVFDPEFLTDAQASMVRCNDGVYDDPWCIGVFVENELGWGNDSISLAVATLRSPADQAAKVAFLDDLKKKYGDIGKLNAAWGTEHASWDALLQCTTPPDKSKARADLEAFYTRTAEQYFRVTRDVLKAKAPHYLNLGCRFAAWGANPAVSRAAAKYCDVIGFNLYKHSAASLKLPEGCDIPIIIGEFHFGALDRGMFHTGLVGTGSQEERAKAFKNYVEGALDNPAIVGVQWFEFRDQATTARGDGENYQIGFVDICDTPNPELVKAAREVGEEMYLRRSEK